MRRIELIRRGLLALSFAFLAFLALSIRPAGTRPRAAGGEVAETLVREAGGVRDRIRFRDFVWDETRRDGGTYRLIAAEALGFPDGGDEVFRLKDVRFLTNEEGTTRAVVLSAPRAEFRQSSREVRVFDGVAVDGEGVLLRSESFRYDPVRRTFTSGEAITARRDELVARADRGVMEAREGAVRLSGAVRVRGWDSSGRLLDLAAPEAILRRGGAVEASGGAVLKTPEAILRGDTLGREPVAGGPGDRLRASGNVLVCAFPAPGTLDAPAHAEAAAAELQRDGAGRPSALLVERAGPKATLRLAPSGTSGARRADSDRFLGRFEGGRLVELTVPGPLLASESSSGPSESGSGTRTVEAGFARFALAREGTGLEDASFEKQVTFRDGARAVLRASSGHVDGRRGEAVFSESGGRPATYRDERGTIEASSLRWNRKDETLDAAGNVRTRSTGGGRVNLPGGQPGEPYYSESERLRLGSRERTAILSGNVRVWQKENVLRSDRLTVRDSDRSLLAEGDVRATVHRHQARSGDASGSEGRRGTDTVTLTGARLSHREAERIVLVEGGTTVSSGSWGLSSRALDVFLTGEREIERAVARGSVVVEDRKMRRRGDGTRASWDAKAEIVRLDGEPATAIDGRGNRLTGARLTFRQGQSRVDVDSLPGVGSEGLFRPEGT